MVTSGVVVETDFVVFGRVVVTGGVVVSGFVVLGRAVVVFGRAVVVVDIGVVVSGTVICLVVSAGVVERTFVIVGSKSKYVF